MWLSFYLNMVMYALVADLRICFYALLSRVVRKCFLFRKAKEKKCLASLQIEHQANARSICGILWPTVPLEGLKLQENCLFETRFGDCHNKHNNRTHTARQTTNTYALTHLQRELAIFVGIFFGCRVFTVLVCHTLTIY